MDAPTSSSAPVIMRRKREVTAEWPVDETHVATLSVYHHQGSKSFSATLRQVTVEPDGSRSFMVFDGITVGRQRVSRYSDQAISDYFNLMLALVEKGRADGLFTKVFNSPGDGGE